MAQLTKLSEPTFFILPRRAFLPDCLTFGQNPAHETMLKTSALFQPPKQYVTETDLCVSGTIFEGV